LGVFLPTAYLVIEVPSLPAPLVDKRLSDPDILLRCPLATHIPRIAHATRLNQEQFDLVLGVRFVLHPLRNDEHLSRPDMHHPVPKINPQISFDHDERLVSVFVIMPDEVSLQLHHLELVIVHFSDHFWLPLLIEQVKLLHKVDCSVFHLISSTFAVFSPPNTSTSARWHGVDAVDR
jgi:hypothetical protein